MHVVASEYEDLQSAAPQLGSDRPLDNALDDCWPAVHGCLEQAAQLVGLRLTGPVHLGDNGRRGLDAPLTALRICLRSAVESLMSAFLSTAEGDQYQEGEH